MPRTVTIVIDKTAAIKRFEQTMWKLAKMLKQPQSVEQVWNLQADHEEQADNDMMNASFEHHLWEGVELMREYLTAAAYGTGTSANAFTVSLSVPSNWSSHVESTTNNAPALKYALLELIQNGMMADWLEGMKPDQANAYKKQAELNKAQIHSTVYALDAP